MRSIHRHSLGHWRRIPAQLQPDRIKVLRKQRSLTDEEQSPGGCIHRGRIRIEQAPRLRSTELTDIDATGFGTALHGVQEVTAIGEELRKTVITPVAAAPIASPRTARHRWRRYGRSD